MTHKNIRTSSVALILFLRFVFGAWSSHQARAAFRPQVTLDGLRDAAYQQLAQNASGDLASNAGPGDWSGTAWSELRTWNAATQSWDGGGTNWGGITAGSQVGTWDATESLLVVLNNGTTSRQVSIPVSAYLADGLAWQDLLNGGSYPVDQGTVTLTIPARWGSILQVSQSPSPPEYAIFLPVSQK